MQKAFTLIELVVALAILAIAAHLASIGLERAAAQRRSAEAARRLSQLRDAVWSIGADGRQRGFLCDVGRLPRSLSELWTRPADVREFAVTNTGGGAWVPTGWRGPYIRLEAGKRAFYDPWGNDFGVATNALGLVTNVFHCGARGIPSEERIDMPVAPPGGASASLVVIAAEETALVLSGPDGAGGVTNATAVATPATPARFAGFAPGAKILKSARGVRLVELMPGDNIIDCGK